MKRSSPCPFCGGTKVVTGNDYDPRRVRLFVECCKCFARGPLLIVPYSDDVMANETGETIVMERWNARLVVAVKERKQ